MNLVAKISKILIPVFVVWAHWRLQILRNSLHMFGEFLSNKEFVLSFAYYHRAR